MDIERIDPNFRAATVHKDDVAEKRVPLRMRFKRSGDLQTLTAREHDVLSLLVRGHSYKMAAAQLEIGVETLRFHIKNIYTKLHVNSKSEAVAKALQNRLV